MKKLLLLLALIPLLTISCKNNDGATRPNPEGEQEVEITLRSAQAPTRATIVGVPDEQIVENLDLLVFKGDKFQYWRSSYRINTNYRATLVVDSGIDVYVIANSRDALIGLFTDQEGAKLHKDKTWEQIRALLIDTNPTRLVQSGATFTALPMWGTLKNQKVEDVPLNRWPKINMIRSVASVDVHINEDIKDADFLLTNIRLYFAPSKGYLGVSDANYDIPTAIVGNPDSPSGTETNLTLFSDAYVSTTEGKAISNKLYLYDNDVEEGTATATKRFTRLVIGGKYKGTEYFYPVDFVEPGSGDVLARIIRNWKYKCIVNSVSGPGYSDPDIASTEPSVSINVTVVDWNFGDEGHFGMHGPYYVWIEKLKVELARNIAFSSDIKMESNMLPEVITLHFAPGGSNGDETEVANGIHNERFNVDKLIDAAGKITGLRFTTRGDYHTTDPLKNTDVVILRAGKVEFKILINQIGRSPEDWDLGDDQDEILGE